MSPIDLPPPSGITLITGPSNVGKTRLTARAIRSWVDANGSSGVVVLEFAPEIEREGRILGGRLDRFGPLPEGIWTGVLDAHAPRSEADTDTEAVELAADNADRAARILDAAPEPSAVFVNDATIPFQHDSGDLEAFVSYLDRAKTAVLNAYESDELGVDDPVSRQERRALTRLRGAADRHIRLTEEP